jgi:hypothetical protein
LLKELPDNLNYRVIFMRRHLQEVLDSQTKMLDRRGEDSETSDQRMFELWENHLWKVNYMLKHAKHMDYLEVHYAEVLEDPAAHARQIAEFVGGDLDVEAMSQVADRNLYRNRAPEEAKKTAS